MTKTETAAHENELNRIASDFTAKGLPPRMWGGIARYLAHGIPPGGFLTAVISNDLRGSVAHGDDENINLLPQYVKFFYNCVSSNCWGSPKRFDAWIDKGGFVGGAQ